MDERGVVTTTRHRVPRGATVSGMHLTPADYADALERGGADPSHSLRSLVASVRALGLTGGDRRVREGVRLFKARHGHGPPSGEWVSRAQAQDMLGLKRARVDQLRRAGVLEGERNPHTGMVRLRRASVEAELARRSGA